MSDVPEARELIKDVISDPLTDVWARERLEMALSLLHRKPPIRKAPKVNPAPTPQQIWEVLYLFRTHGDWSQQKIAEQVGLNSGRVSEIVNKYA